MSKKKEKIILNVIFENSFDIQVYRPIISNSVCAVIDILRATSSIAAILEAGCERILIARNKEEAYTLKNMLNSYILCGEENRLPPKGFDYGNSPYEFSKLNLYGKKIILMTTNGTVSFFKLLESDDIFALSLLNMSSVLKEMAYTALKKNKDILILCSGRNGISTYDDVFSAGIAVKYLSGILGNDCTLSDSAYIALDIIKENYSITEALKKSCGGQDVINAGLSEDLYYCANIDQYLVVPKLKVIYKDENNFTPYEYRKDILDVLSANDRFDKILLIEPLENSDNF